MNKLTTLLEVDGWEFMREPRMMGEERDYIFLAHTSCPKGVELECPRAGLPSVMHYYEHMCQRCGAQPPDGLFGAYKLYIWGTGAQI